MVLKGLRRRITGIEAFQHRERYRPAKHSSCFQLHLRCGRQNPNQNPRAGSDRPNSRLRRPISIAATTNAAVSIDRGGYQLRSDSQGFPKVELGPVASAPGSDDSGYHHWCGFGGYSLAVPYLLSNVFPSFKSLPFVLNIVWLETT